MRIEEELKLDYSDVLFRPKRSTLSSRKDVDLNRTYKFKYSKNDKYLKPQKYEKVTDVENRIWADLFKDLEPLLNQYASKEYLVGLNALSISKNIFPNFEEISPLIHNAMGNRKRNIYMYCNCRY